MMRWTLLGVVVGVLGVGCGDDSGAGTGGSAGSGGGDANTGATTAGSGGGDAVTVDDAAISADAADLAGLTQVNDTAFQSAQHEGAPMVNVYVNGVAASTYAAVGGSAVTYPEGSLIVKEMLDPEGATMMLTAMYKAPAGYDADNRDWWWGMLMPSGEPAQSGSVGKLAMCNGCHGPQVDGDSTFGLPE